MREIAHFLGGFGGLLPPKKIHVLGSQRLILIHSTPFYERVQSLVASPFPCAARGVAISRSQRRLSRTGESVHRLDDHVITNETGGCNP